MSATTKTWNGIPLDQINWFPEIDLDKCNKCLECVSFCSHGVFGQNDRNEPVISEPYNCVVGCTGCQKVCSTHAISHPPKEYLDSFPRRAPVSGCTCGMSLASDNTCGGKC